MYAIETNQLTKRYRDVTAVDGLSLQIRRGELFSLLGINGAGKSTTVKMLSCLLRPDGGDALLEGHSIKAERNRVKGIIGVCPQETAVAPNLTVRENLELICGVHGFDRQRTGEMVAQTVNQLELSEILEKRAGKLSGGWQRRLSIAMALISQPKILFLDEPTLGLDVIARSALWERIRALKGHITIVLTTHYMEEAEALSDRIGIMGKGRLLAVGTAEELKAMSGQDSVEKAFVAIVKGVDER